MYPFFINESESLFAFAKNHNLVKRYEQYMGDVYEYLDEHWGNEPEFDEYLDRLQGFYPDLFPEDYLLWEDEVNEIYKNV